MFPVLPVCHSTPMRTEVASSGRELPCQGPARVVGGHSQRFALGQIVQFEDHSIDFKPIGTPLAPANLGIGQTGVFPSLQKAIHASWSAHFAGWIPRDVFHPSEDLSVVRKGWGRPCCRGGGRLLGEIGRRKPGRPNLMRRPFRHRASAARPLPPGYGGWGRRPGTSIRMSDSGMTTSPRT